MLENKGMLSQKYSDQWKRERLLTGQPLNFPKDLFPRKSKGT